MVLNVVLIGWCGFECCIDEMVVALNVVLINGVAFNAVLVGWCGFECRIDRLVWL